MAVVLHQHLVIKNVHDIRGRIDYVKHKLSDNRFYIKIDNQRAQITIYAPLTSSRNSFVYETFLPHDEETTYARTRF